MGGPACPGPILCVVIAGDVLISNQSKATIRNTCGGLRVLRANLLPPAYLWPLLILLAAAILLGGGGTPAPQMELILQLGAALCFIMMLYGPARMSTNRLPPPLAWMAAGVIMIVPFMQLVPLPPVIWQAMPGREVQMEALGIVGAQDDWRSWSLFPDRTFAGLLAIVPAVIALLMMSRLDPQDFKWPVAVIMMMIFLSLLLGAGQLAAGNDTALRFYAQSNPGFLNGFQANRNAQADILLIGMVAASATIGILRARAFRTSAAGLAIAALAVLVLGTILTGSRTGIVLIPVALIFSALAWYGFHRKVILCLGGSVPIAIISLWLLQQNGAIQKVLGRFDAQTDLRSELWSDAIFAIGTYWPFGAGIGSGAPILAAVERLEMVDITIPHRVHNDYLESILESGIFGALSVAALGALVIYASFNNLKKSGAEARRVAYFPFAVIAIVGLHSIMDYPLRSMSLAIVAAAALGIVFARPTGTAEDVSNGVQESSRANGVKAT